MIISKLTELPTGKVSHNEKISKKQILDNSTHSALTQFAQATFPPGEIAGGHSHSDMTEVFFIQSGSGTIVIDQQSFAIDAGTTITVQPGEEHQLENTGDEDLVVLYFGLAGE